VTEESVFTVGKKSYKNPKKIFLLQWDGLKLGVFPSLPSPIVFTIGNYVRFSSCIVNRSVTFRHRLFSKRPNNFSITPYRNADSVDAFLFP